MSGAVLIVLSYLLLAVAAVAFVGRTVRIARLPIHLRWELAPVPHERGKGHYGGSYLEEPQWWSKPRNPDHRAEAIYMFKEIVFLKALFEHNRRLWRFSFPFHFGLYLLIPMAGLVVVAAVAQLFGLGGGIASALGAVITPLAGLGYVLGGLGAAGVLLNRMFDRELRSIATPLTFINLIVLLAFLASGATAVLLLPDFAAQAIGFTGALMRADAGVELSGMLAAHVVFAGLFLAWLPFTPMMHLVAKYFTYHQVRWDDEPLVPGSKSEVEILELLAQPVSWAAPHVRGNGTKNWVEVATSSGTEEAGQ